MHLQRATNHSMGKFVKIHCLWFFHNEGHEEHEEKGKEGAAELGGTRAPRVAIDALANRFRTF
jgi:hypothetical protein